MRISEWSSDVCSSDLMDELRKYFTLVAQLRAGGEVKKEDIEFFLSYTPSIDQAKMQKLVEGGEFASFEDAQAAMIEAGRALQSSPQYKQRSEEHTSELQSLMRISYAVFCLKKKKHHLMPHPNEVIIMLYKLTK